MPPVNNSDPYRLAGDVFGGRYRLEECVGTGGFGVVYRARHIALNRVVAVKILKPDLGDNAELARKLFKREASVAGELSHRHIVAVTDFGEENGLAYLVMEWLEGHTLDKELQTHKGLSPERTAAILDQLAQALDYAHKKGAIHRDIKPSNIFIVDGGDTVKLLDFGIAKFLGSSTSSTASQVVGSTEYMSPEQILGGEMDGRTDIYSLGVLLFKMLTGRLPFNGTRAAVTQQHLTASPPAVTDIRPELPPQLSHELRRALAKDPNSRQRTVLELRNGFMSALGPRLVKSPQATTDAEASAPPGGRDLREEETRLHDSAWGLTTRLSERVQKISTGSLAKLKSSKLLKFPALMPEVSPPLVSAIAAGDPGGLDYSSFPDFLRDWSPRRIARDLFWALAGAALLLLPFLLIQKVWPDKWCSFSNGILFKAGLIALLIFSALFAFVFPTERDIHSEVRRVARSSYLELRTSIRAFFRTMSLMGALTGFTAELLTFMALVETGSCASPQLLSTGLMLGLWVTGAILMGGLNATRFYLLLRRSLDLEKVIPLASRQHA